MVTVVDMKPCDANADLTSRYLWCQRRLAAADDDGFRDFDTVSAMDRCQHHRCCLLADRLCTPNVVPPGSNTFAVYTSAVDQYPSA